MSTVSILSALAFTCLVALALTFLGRDQGRRHLRQLQSAISWDGTLSVTHYWDCNGQDCDSKTVPAIEDPDSPGTWVWQEQLFSASPLYAPVDPNDYGGPSDYGEKFWATGAANDDLATLLGADVASCGTSDLSPGGCGKCLLVQNDNAINSDWKVMVMKKNRCPPYSSGCEAGKLHLDLAVPGFDDVRFSTGNVCQGNPDGWTRDNVFGMTHASSSSCALWWDGHDDTQTGCDCSSVTSDYGLRAGCELFTQWGWKATESPQLHFKVVDCPDAFISLISGAFSAAGPSDGSSSPTPSPTPDSGDFTYGDACGANGCSDCDDGCQWSWPSNEPEGYDGSNAACRCNPDLTSIPVTSTMAPTPAPPTCEYAAQANRAVKNRGTGGKKLKRKKYGSTAEYLADCEARCNDDASCDCVTLRPSDGKCWKRKHCAPDQFGNDGNFNTYVKPYTPSPPAPPTPAGGGSGCETTSGWINQYDGSNSLDVKPDLNRENNYFLIIGDWGKDGGPGSCQSRVADLMKQYVQNQAALGKTLLFIAAVGDNFYWSGQDGSKWSNQWDDVYGHSDPNSPLYDIPWLAVLGNHDIGYSDPYLACPSIAKYGSMGGQDYGSRQFNKDKNSERPDWTRKFWMPDYNWHYEIPQIGVEVVGVDTNGDHIDDLNGHGHADAVFGPCGGRGNVGNFLGMIKNSGDDVLKCRAEKGTASTVLVMQHYPSNKLDVLGKFNNALQQTGRQARVISAYGHDHEQKCEGTDEQGQCNVIMTGSGGGCCDSDLPKNHAGFTAIHLTKDGGFTSDVESEDVRLPRGACTWYYDEFASWWNDTRAHAYV